jgi:predicted TIM-barrel fold metal-dependent hydrolase
MDDDISRPGVIDFHVHIGHDVDGKSRSASTQVSEMERVGIDAAVVFPFNLGADGDYGETNVGLHRECSGIDRLIPFARINPTLDSFEEGMVEAMELGFRGFKIHPKYQKFEIGDVPGFFEVADRLGLPVIAHSAHRDGVYAAELVEVSHSYPSMVIVLGHAALSESPDTTLLRSARGCPNLFFETSINRRPRIERLILSLGPEKVVFGSDEPYGSAPEALEAIRSIEMSEEEMDMVLGGNARSILGI